MHTDRARNLSILNCRYIECLPYVFAKSFYFDTEFIKENKKVRKQEITLWTKKAIKKKRKKERKHALDQKKSDQKKRKERENILSTKKVRFKKYKINPAR